jgi:hypothetical protein
LPRSRIVLAFSITNRWAAIIAHGLDAM